MGDQPDRLVTIPIHDARLEGELVVPDGATGLVVFAHGSGIGAVRGTTPSPRCSERTGWGRYCSTS